jgi:hypothetical protein
LTSLESAWQPFSEEYFPPALTKSTSMAHALLVASIFSA